MAAIFFGSRICRTFGMLVELLNKPSNRPGCVDLAESTSDFNTTGVKYEFDFRYEDVEYEAPGELSVSLRRC